MRGNVRGLVLLVHIIPLSFQNAGHGWAHAWLDAHNKVSFVLVYHVRALWIFLSRLSDNGHMILRLLVRGLRKRR